MEAQLVIAGAGLPSLVAQFPSDPSPMIPPRLDSVCRAREQASLYGAFIVQVLLNGPHNATLPAAMRH
jgi:hypothetical protein